MQLRFACGRLWMRVDAEVQLKLRRALGGFACQGLCGFRLRRPHLTCLFCRRRRVYYGKMQSEFAVTPYVLLIRCDRRFRGARDALLKLVLTVAEWLGS